MRRGRFSVARVLLPLALAAVLIALGAQPGAAQERPGTLSLGIQGQFGLIAGASDFAELYDNGAGFAFRIRYALGGPQAIGISFENQTFTPDNSQLEGTRDDPRELSFANASVEYLRYFNRGQGQSQYVVAGVGFYHPSDERVQGVAPASDGLILLFGGGAEIFFLRATSIDVSVRANAFLGDAISTTLEAAVGLHHYLVN